MKGTRFTIEPRSLMGSTDVTWLDDEGWVESLKECVLQDIGTTVEITISGVTMFLAAWLDPEHWSEDWKEKLKLVNMDEAPDAVAELIAQAQEE